MGIKFLEEAKRKRRQQEGRKDDESQADENRSEAESKVE